MVQEQHTACSVALIQKQSENVKIWPKKRNIFVIYLHRKTRGEEGRAWLHI